MASSGSPLRQSNTRFRKARACGVAHQAQRPQPPGFEKQRQTQKGSIMIPKIIHYCWFGGNPLPPLAKKCIESWRRYCPNYEIRRWDESNFDLNISPYAREAYQAKKWAFVTDYVRLYALVNFGGIYMDTDVEIVKPLDALLGYEAVSGFESETMILTGFMASEAGQPMFVKFLNDYSNLHFVKEDGSFDKETNVKKITRICTRYGFAPNNMMQTVNGLTLLPKDYLCPKDFATGVVRMTENTYAIHHFDGSWLSDEERYLVHVSRKLPRFVPEAMRGRIGRVASLMKYRGVSGAGRYLLQANNQER
nr:MULTISPECIES: glycosyltransferase [unclassified Adlercreutzia]